MERNGDIDDDVISLTVIEISFLPGVLGGARHVDFFLSFYF